MRVTLEGEVGLPDLDVGVDVVRDNNLVVLHMLEFDSERVASLVQRLTFELGVRFDDSLFEHVLNNPRYGLVVDLAGRRHPTRLGHLADGQVTVYLGDPDAAYLERCRLAIDQVLGALHQRGIEAVVHGIDEYGRPRPIEGFLHLLAAAQGTRQEEEVIELAKGISEACDVDLISLGFQIHRSVRLDAHFAWDLEEGRVVRRNWGGGV